MSDRKSSHTLLPIVCMVSLIITLCASLSWSQYYPYEDQPIETYESVAINGDVNADGQICMDDSIQIIYHLWRDGRELPCHNAADVDRNGSININDVLWGLRHIFFGEYINDCPVECDGVVQPD